MANQKSLSSAEQRPLPTWLGLRSSWDSPVRPSQQKYGGRCRPRVQPDLWRIEALGSPRSHVKQCRGRRLQDRQAGQRTRLSGLSSHTFAAARFADFLHLSLSVFPLFCLYSSPRVPSSFLLTTTLLPTRPLRKAFSFEDHASFPSHLSLLNYLYFFFSALMKTTWRKQDLEREKSKCTKKSKKSKYTAPSLTQWPWTSNNDATLASNGCLALCASKV